MGINVLFYIFIPLLILFLIFKISQIKTGLKTNVLEQTAKAITQKKEYGISTFMQKVSTAYVMYYNKKYKRTGGLFEGKFKSKYVEGDTYMKYLFSYIHLNPLKILDKNWKLQAKYPSRDMLEFLLSYKYSSFCEYYANVFSVVCKQDFPDYFPTRDLLVKDVTLWFDASL